MKLYWKDKNGGKGKELSPDQHRAFSWLIKLLKKDKKDLTDPERLAQEMYKNIIIFS